MIGDVNTVSGIVTIEGDIQLTVVDMMTRQQGTEFMYQLIRHKDSPGLYPNNNRVLKVQMTLQDLVAKPLDGYCELLFIKDRFQKRSFDVAQINSSC